MWVIFFRAPRCSGVSVQRRWCWNRGTYRVLVLDRIDLGASSELLLELSAGFELKVIVPGGPDFQVGVAYEVALPPASIRLWPAPTDATRTELSRSQA